MIAADQLDHPRVSHGFFTRGGGHSTGIFASLNCGLGSGDDPDLVAGNRAIVARQLQVEPTHLVTAHQIHSADVVTVTTPWATADRPKADAMVTTHPGIALGVLTADCCPVLFADPEAGVIGAAHAGWKGALAGVTSATIAAMVEQGARRSHITAVIGPCISQEAYEVGPAFPQPFLAADPAAQGFFRPSATDGHFMFDLPAYVLRRLKQEGVATAINMELCTYADEARFYSYRRATHRGEKDYGRLISAIALQ